MSTSENPFASTNLSTGGTTVGFLEDRFDRLPSALTILLGIYLILIGLGFAIGGARSLLLGNQWGKERGSTKNQPWIAGGVGGLLFGSTAFGTISTILAFLIVSKQTDPPLNPIAVLALMICSALLGAFLGGRWRWGGRACCGALGGLACSLLLIASVHLSSISARAILSSILIITGVILCLLPQTIKALSVYSAFVGAWLFFVGVDLFIKVGFLDLPGLIVSPFGASKMGKTLVVLLDWDDVRWKACLAGWWLIAITGAAWQCYWGGEAGGAEMTWDAYLDTLIGLGEAPNSSLGTFTPPTTFFSRLFNRKPAARFTNLPGGFKSRSNRAPWEDDEADLVRTARVWAEDDSDFDSEDEDTKPKRHRRKSRDIVRQIESNKESEEYELRLVPELSSASSTKPARYHAALSDDEDEDDDTSEYKSRTAIRFDRTISPTGSQSTVRFMSSPKARTRPIFVTSHSSQASILTSDSTLVSGSPKSVKHGSRRPSLAPSDSDRSCKTVKTIESLAVMPSVQDGVPEDQFKSSERLDRKQERVVPATPSLIRAIDRINVAQKEARAAGAAQKPNLTTQEERQEEAERADDDEVTEEIKVTSHGADLKPSRSVNARKASYDDWWAKVVKKSGAKE